MALSPGQTAEATKVYNEAVSRGLPPQRAKELVLAAFHESSLNPDAQGPAVASYGGQRAGGDFQLLSPGYVSKANAHGGVFNTVANEDAILPDYQRFWQQHPGAPVGAAAAAVERSGKGADYYGAGGDLFNFLGSVGGAPSRPQRTPMAAGGGPAPSSDARTQFALTIAQSIGSHKFDPQAILGALDRLHASEGDAAAPAQLDPVAAGHANGDLHARFGVPVADLTSVSGLHPTEGLNGFPAHDYFAPAGTPVVAPITGTVVRLSGHDPALGPIEGPHGPLGWSVYVKGADGRTYYMTHLGSRDVKVGEKLHTGQPIGTVADYSRYGTPSHVHMGVSS